MDVREAERLAADGRLADALELLDGELLTDLDDDWVLEERRRHRDRVEELLAALGTPPRRTATWRRPWVTRAGGWSSILYRRTVPAC